MEKKGKVDLLSVLIASILIFVVFALLVLADSDQGVDATFPQNGTNASATRGFAPSGGNNTFNGSNASFHCNVRINTSIGNNNNITNVSIYIMKGPPVAGEAEVKNQTLNATGFARSNSTFIFNLTNTLDEGVYHWYCFVESNNTADAFELYNTSRNLTFRVDKTPPGVENLSNQTPSTTEIFSTGNKIYITANFTDNFTDIHTVRLFVNVSGTRDNVVNASTDATNGVNPTNKTNVSMAFIIPGIALGDVLNFTLFANDSVNNYVVTRALIFEITGDGTAPGITLNGPINMTNQTSTTAPTFNFTAFDNNETTNYNFTCNTTLTMGGSNFTNISNIDVINGSVRVNTTDTALSNGTYIWNVSCTDDIGNTNNSLFRVFTVDQIPPVITSFNLFNITANTTNESRSEQTLGSPDPSAVPNSGAGTWAQGRTFKVFANITENLTTGLEADLQFFNISSGNWESFNTTDDNNLTKYASTVVTANYSVTFNFTPPVGHNIFSGRNVSFRIISNDSVGNINTSNSVRNITIQINDTTAPTVAINGTIAVNLTNTSDTTPLIGWYIIEGKQFTRINVSIDSNTIVGTGKDTNCGLAAFYDTTQSGPDNVERHRNDSIEVTDDPACTLTNGTHFVNVTAVDSSGNTVQYGFEFNVQTGSPEINLTSLENGLSAVNMSNVTPNTGINFTAWSTGTGIMKSFNWTSSCNSSTQVISSKTANFVQANLSFIYPFANVSNCSINRESNQTVTISVSDDAGNTLTQLFQFAVDDLAPLITVESPTNGTDTTGIVVINVTAFDQMNRISTIGYFLDGIDANPKDLKNHTINGSISLTTDQGHNTSYVNRSVNFTTGTHSLVVSVNDTQGNVRNSTKITFTYRGPINFLTVNSSLIAYLQQQGLIGGFNFSNVSLFNSSGGLISDSSTPRVINDITEGETLELRILLNTTAYTNKFTNISINFNGSDANWNGLNFSILKNRTVLSSGALANLSSLENNHSVYVVDVIVFNRSLQNFLSNNNSYYGFIDMALNASNVSTNVDGGGSLGGTVELWYFADETDLTRKTNVTQCNPDTAFTRTTSSPCWNNTLNETVRVYVPHFSMLALVNNTRAPTVNINFPTGTQTESSFLANITVSNDAVLCNISYFGGSKNISRPVKNQTMAGPTAFGSEKICTYHLNVTNGTIENINITFSVYDIDDNLNFTQFNFNVSDSTEHNLTSLTISSVTSVAATVTITANESVNMSINSTGSNVLDATHYSNQSNFGKTNSITFSSLASSTKYNFTVQTCDKAGNCIFNWTFGFTTDTAAAAAKAGGAAAASGGGGGGGGAAAVSAVTDSKAQVWQSVPAGSSVSLEVDKSAIAVTSVIVSDIKSDLKGVELEVAALSENPVTTEAAAKVYQYFRITKKNIADADAESFKVAFRVTKSWLSENGLASADVALYRFADSEWNELATKVASTDATYVNYEADTPGFSSFAIGTKSGVKVEEKAPIGEEAGEEEKEAAPPEAVEAPKPVEAPGKAPVAWIIAAVVIILGIVLIVAYQKQKKKA